MHSFLVQTCKQQNTTTCERGGNFFNVQGRRRALLMWWIYGKFRYETSPNAFLRETSESFYRVWKLENCEFACGCCLAGTKHCRNSKFPPQLIIIICNKN